MEQLKTLQRQFEAAADKFGSMAHLIICSDQISVLNIPDKHMPNSDNRVDDWTTDNELHYLLRLEGADWDKKAALCKLKTLADKATGWLLDNKDTPDISDILSGIVGLGFGNPVYMWLLILRHLRPNEAIKITGGCGDNRRAAKDNEPYYSILEDVFLESALVLGELLSRVIDSGKPETSNTHSADFSSVMWNGKKYIFNATQADCIRLLWAEWEKGGLGLREWLIAKEIDSANEKFRLAHVFRGKGGKGMHQAWGKMIHSQGNGYHCLGTPPEKT